MMEKTPATTLRLSDDQLRLLTAPQRAELQKLYMIRDGNFNLEPGEYEKTVNKIQELEGIARVRRNY